MKTPLSHKLRVIEIPGVVSLVGSGAEPVPLPETEIERLRRTVQEFAVEPHPFLSIGQRVRIVRGPLEGCEGVLERKKGSFNLVITVAAILRSFSVEVQAHEVERI